MILKINTIAEENNYIVLELDTGKKAYKKRVKAPYRQGEKLLVSIDKIMEKAGASFSDLECIKVVNKGGSFTSLRIGIVTANALGYALGIPVFPMEGDCQKAEGKFSVVWPEYDGEPNIGKKGVGREGK